ncbi:MAG: tetratricopeptide repeat protein [bacterium]|nr:tetratricopeptide repeat protein [bacterium]
MLKRILIIGLIGFSFSGCLQTESRTEDTAIVEDTVTTQDFQAISLSGITFSEKTFSNRELQRRLAKLEEAKNNFDSNPDSLDYIIWYGRRLAYLSKYKEAISVYTNGLKKHPNSYQLLRHRGHRFITTRQFAKAIKDLEEAAFYVRGMDPMIEQDGLPNKQNIPLSTTQYNIWYHLGLAYYLSGNYDKAISSYKKCLEFSDNNDLLVSTTDWLYMTYRKIGNTELSEELLSPIKKRMKLIENNSYHQRLLLYKGELEPEDLLDISVGTENTPVTDPTIAYGVGNWFLYNGNADQAKIIFERIVANDNWDMFGYIAAEVDLLTIGSL